MGEAAERPGASPDSWAGWGVRGGPQGHSGRPMRPEPRAQGRERREAGGGPGREACLLPVHPEPENPERKGSRAPLRRERERTSPQPRSSKESRGFEAANHLGLLATLK